MTSLSIHQENAELQLNDQIYGDDPLSDRETGLYRAEYVMSFVEKWDELIDWDARSESEGRFFVDVLRARDKQNILDVATGTGFHSVRLTEAGFNVTSADGSAAMLAKAFENGRKRGLILRTVQADWRELNRDIQGKYDAIICLGNSFTHLHDEHDRRRALAEFYAALRHDGILILDQRNYDEILDHGFKSKHKYYYCGDQVTAEPEYVDEGLARFKYDFPDGSEYTLNMFPLRKSYVRRLMREAGFTTVRTYGDFQESYEETEPDFFIHVAEKSLASEALAEPDIDAALTGTRAEPEAYYDSDDANAFYSMIWGGEDIHVGCYEDTRDIGAAARETVDRMVRQLTRFDGDTRVLDLGAGYGGCARHLASDYGSSVTCLNISEAQNETNRERNRNAGLDAKIRVVHGSFEAIPEPDGSYDVVWSQDAILHAADRRKVIEEAFRVLKAGGELIFTDPMQADEVPDGVLTPVYDRLNLADLGSMRFYRETALAVGFEVVDQIDLVHNLGVHYQRVLEELETRRRELDEHSSTEYLDKMRVGLRNWVDSAREGHLAWGIQHFRKPD
ncbi:Glycine/sarcosine/dimethylglycine N-methyltransferase [Mycobacterium marinum]|uniref:glycine/sarcosine N-methyltransferase n=1 Tax=Mycobacterium marinum TaxID=1781 RepID=UPI00041C2101|nr:Glycine/sarcosine/dimethylglycine N-methyltransferase [Mycobacterium marinum]AXN48230.1 Glycine/sarcosine/dimethylglycine N-methyltransferase [Mycobacterium marinum]RFZ04873.1 Glycine/sarcosine/dimethylglycine N-methyltransferase [Mycobacterium marinum]RFZ08032.1 Glycine/sarcosine/dimethylglycine N-methyltransferase [Mycobacterium marinum]RFZ08709.1 Glycine/sarcosine/dimethylglycine N-methyltransferase [Mycobacterium marinum]